MRTFVEMKTGLMHLTTCSSATMMFLVFSTFFHPAFCFAFIFSLSFFLLFNIFFFSGYFSRASHTTDLRTLTAIVPWLHYYVLGWLATSFCTPNRDSFTHKPSRHSIASFLAASSDPFLSSTPTPTTSPG